MHLQRDGLVGQHMYAVLEIQNDGKISLGNPHGKNHVKLEKDVLKEAFSDAFILPKP
jgi:hypothetical protein